MTAMGAASIAKVDRPMYLPNSATPAESSPTFLTVGADTVYGTANLSSCHRKVLGCNMFHGVGKSGATIGGVRASQG